MAKDLPDVEALIAGIRVALDMYLAEAHLDRAVGETGKIRVSFELDLNKGRVERSKGACYFERYVNLGGQH